MKKFKSDVEVGIISLPHRKGARVNRNFILLLDLPETPRKPCLSGRVKEVRNWILTSELEGLSQFLNK